MSLMCVCVMIESFASLLRGTHQERGPPPRGTASWLLVGLRHAASDSPCSGGLSTGVLSGRQA